MLDEQEWETISPLLSAHIAEIKRLRQEGRSLQDAMKKASKDACDFFQKMTGFEETNVNAIWHHRRSLFGPDCPACGKPYRTPKASFCAACGFKAKPEK